MSALQRELKQGQPFASLAEEAYLSLLRTAEHLRAEENALLRPFGLSQPQYNVLRILRGAGPDGHPCQEIGARMIARVPDVTRLVDRLEEQGLVERTRNADDRRVVRVRILRQGLDLLGRIDAPLAAAVDRMLEPLPQQGQRQLITLLARLRGTDGRRVGANARQPRGARGATPPGRTSIQRRPPSESNP